MTVATKRIRKHASAIPYFLIANSPFASSLAFGGVPCTDGALIERELSVPSLPEADSPGGFYHRQASFQPAPVAFIPISPGCTTSQTSESLPMQQPSSTIAFCKLH